MYVLIVMAMVAIPMIVAIVRGTNRFWLVAGLAFLSVMPGIGIGFFLVALAVALFTAREAPRMPKLNGSMLVISALLLVMLAGSSSASGISWEHHARKNDVQDNQFGNCLFKLHQDAFWNDTGDQFTAYDFQKSYDNCLYRLNHWNQPQNDGGRYPYGTRWRYQKISAQFEACAVVHGVPGCTYLTGWMWTKIDTQGNVQSDHGYY